MQELKYDMNNNEIYEWNEKLMKCMKKIYLINEWMNNKRMKWMKWVNRWDELMDMMKELNNWLKSINQMNAWDEWMIWTDKMNK